MALPTVEEILLARAIDNAENQPDMGAAIALGSGLGTLGGYAAMAPAQSVANAPGNAINMLKDAAASRKGAPREDIKRRPRKGLKKAGGLIGLLVGGGLGAGLTNQILRESPEARLLAKIQVTGRIEPEDEILLTRLLEDYYRNPSQLA